MGRSNTPFLLILYNSMGYKIFVTQQRLYRPSQAADRLQRIEISLTKLSEKKTTYDLQIEAESSAMHPKKPASLLNISFYLQLHSTLQHQVMRAYVHQ